MSLMMLGLRIAAVEALRAGGTIVGSNVMDSGIAAIDATADGRLSVNEKRPFISIYTDGAKEMNAQKHGPRANGDVDLVCNFGVTQAMTTTAEDGTSVISQEVGIDGQAVVVQEYVASDATFEAVLDVIEGQITHALTDPGNEWAQIFGAFVQGYRSRTSARSSSGIDGQRIAVGQIKLGLSVFPDPVRGADRPADGIWSNLLAQMSSENHPQRALLESALDGNIPNYPDFERLFGMTTTVADSLLLRPAFQVSGDVTFSAQAPELENQ